MTQFRPCNKAFYLTVNFAGETLLNVSGNKSSEAGLAKPNVDITSSNDLAHLATLPLDFIGSQYIYNQYETVLRHESSDQSLQLILVMEKTARGNTRSVLLDSFDSAGKDDDAFIVKGQLTDRAHPQIDPNAQLTHRPSSPQNIVITARAFAVDRLNRIISTDREDIAAIDEELVSEQAKISDLESLRELKRRLR